MSAARLVPLLVVAFALSVALVAAGIWQNKTRSADADRLAKVGATSKYEPLWPVPEFRYIDQRGREVTPQSLRGQVWVANFIFTQCRTVCPLLTAKMVQLSRRLSGSSVRFVSFSVDPAHDTPEVLAAYAQKWAPEERRWTLLATDEASLPALVDGFHITRRTSTDAIDPIIHSSVFVLVDANGQVRGAFDSEHRADFEALERGVRLLLGGDRTPGAELPEAPADLYHALSCADCHERPELAPPLVDLRGRRRELDNGLTVTADAEWVRESILRPDAKRVRGYPLRMPTYDGLLDEARLSALVTWVLERTSPANERPGEEARVVTDPVCHMQVRVMPDTPSASAGGHTYWFCSELCRTKLLADPQRYGAPK